jgi:two-component system, OmpR family, phosphate regulon response regulator PhoB
MKRRQPRRISPFRYLDVTRTTIRLPKTMGAREDEVPAILIVSADAEMASSLDQQLREARFLTAIASSGRAALRELHERRPDLAVVDDALHDLPGIEVCREVKADPATRDVPLVMLTAAGDEPAMVVAFEQGADDVLAKPFSMRELALRIRAVLRHTAAPGLERRRTSVGRIEVDVATHRAFVDGSEVALSRLEFRLVTVLMARSGRVVSRQELLANVWNLSTELKTRTIDTHVKRLRAKLGSARGLLETVRGIGYRLVSQEAAGHVAAASRRLELVAAGGSGSRRPQSAAES